MADSEARASVFMNRRIRNRTSGGVGGRRGWQHPRLLPDVEDPHQRGWGRSMTLSL